MTALLETSSLTIAAGDRVLVRALSLSLRPGTLLAVLGPNGVGKTLTLHTLAGLRPAVSGTVYLAGQTMDSLGQRARARICGLLLQEHDDPFPTTVMQTALMGRHARLGLLQWETSEDESAAREALQVMDLADMEAREAGSLSGGERRRLALATLHVQDPAVWLLDEPLNHLDPRHQLAVLAQLRQAAAAGKAIVASLHDPAQVLRHFEQALLLHGDGRWELCAAADLLDGARLEALYSVPYERWHSASGAIMLPRAEPAPTSLA